MARIFPETPVTVLPPAVYKTFQFMKSLPDDYIVWHHFTPWQEDAPDFLIFNENRQALLVIVSQAADPRAGMQLLLGESQNPVLGETEHAVLHNFLSSDNGKCRWVDLISTAVIYPNLSSKQIRDFRPLSMPKQPFWIGKEALKPGAFQSWAACFTGPVINQDEQDMLRTRFTPEVAIPAALSVRKFTERQLEAGLTSHILDYDQERVLKTDLSLPEAGSSIAGNFSLNIVTGVAGGGKTLILLFRLRMMMELFPGKRFLVLTHNRSLAQDMQARFYRLCGKFPDTITWATFNGWCRKKWPQGEPWVNPIGQERRNNLIREIWQIYLQQTTISPEMLRSEIDWVKDQVSLNRSGYLTVNRRGRGFRLTSAQREMMFDAIAAYQKGLHAKGLVDWGDIPRRMYSFLEAGQVDPEPYDAIFVDEAQFFAPVWMAIIQQWVKPAVGHLFIAADPTQGFLGRGQSWKSLGLDAHGKTSHLKKCYRTTREIMTFATAFYRQRVGEKGGAILATDLFDLPGGVIPDWIPLKSSQDEIARVANEVAALAGQGFPLEHILVLHVNWKGVQQLIQAIQHRLGRSAAMDPKGSAPGPYVRVTTLHAGTGIESPVVFLVGTRELFEEEQSLRISDGEREALILENTQKIYMAITRTGQRLIFTYVGEMPPIISSLLGRIYPDAQMRQLK